MGDSDIFMHWWQAADSSVRIASQVLQSRVLQLVHCRQDGQLEAPASMHCPAQQPPPTSRPAARWPAWAPLQCPALQAQPRPVCSGGAPAALLWWPRPARWAQRTAGHQSRWGRRRAARRPQQTARRRCSSCSGACWATDTGSRPLCSAVCTSWRWGAGLWLGGGQCSVRRNGAAGGSCSTCWRRAERPRNSDSDRRSQSSRLLAWALRKSRHKPRTLQGWFRSLLPSRQQQWFQRQRQINGLWGRCQQVAPLPAAAPAADHPSCPRRSICIAYISKTLLKYSRSSGYKMASTSEHSAQRCPHTLPSPP